MKRMIVLLLLIISTWTGLSIASAPAEDPSVIHTMACPGAQDPFWCYQ